MHLLVFPRKIFGCKRVFRDYIENHIVTENPELGEDRYDIRVDYSPGVSFQYVRVPAVKKPNCSLVWNKFRESWDNKHLYTNWIFLGPNNAKTEMRKYCKYVEEINNVYLLVKLAVSNGSVVSLISKYIDFKEGGDFPKLDIPIQQAIYNFSMEEDDSSVESLIFG